MLNKLDLIHPDWPAPEGIKAVSTTRLGGFSTAPFDSLNVGDHVGDEPGSVSKNRSRLQEACNIPPIHWLKQVHGIQVHHADGEPHEQVPEADAAVTEMAGQAVCIMTADCLPVLFCDQAGTTVAAAHAGWRGLCEGVLEQTLLAMNVQPDSVMAWLGPAIGPTAFEVGAEVKAAFEAKSPMASHAFTYAEMPDKYMADIYQLARQRLESLGVRCYGGDYCTVTEGERFFSYRRDGKTGRMASLIWIGS